MKLSNETIKTFELCLDLLKPLLKYKNNIYRQELIEDVLEFVFDTLKPSAQVCVEIDDILEKLFEIETKEDYLNYKLVYPEDEFLSIFPLYFHLIENMDGYITFDKSNFIYQLNTSSFKGDLPSIRLKGILLAIGSIYTKNNNLAVKHFEYCAYSGSLICFDFMANIDKDNKEKYLNSKKLITYCIENLITDYSILNLNEKDYTELKIFFNLYNSYTKNQVINLQLAYMSLKQKEMQQMFGFVRKRV